MIQSVIFDLDGLLIDSEMVFYRIYREMLAAIGHEFTLADYLSGFSGRPIRPIMADFISRFGLPATLEEACAHVESEEAEARRTGIPLKPGARQLLEDLRESGRSIALGTSSTRERARSILEAHGILDRFDALICAEDITRGKPDPQVFLSAAAALGTAPAHCLVLEDSEMGIEAAHAAGIPVVCVPDLKQPDEAHRAMTTRVLDSLTELVPELLSTPPCR